MGDELEQLKTVFRSLVVSCPTQMDVRSLLRDYKNMIGAPVPLTKYGYRNPVDFLQERFNDCFLFSGQPCNPVLTLIVPNSLKHIDKFVQKQKVSSTTKFNPKRRSVPEAVVKNFRQCLTGDTHHTSKSTACKPNELITNSNQAKKINDKPRPKETSTKPIETTRESYETLTNANKNRGSKHEGSSKSNHIVSSSKPNIECSVNKVTSSEFIEKSKCKKVSSKHNIKSPVTVPSKSLRNGIKDTNYKHATNKENINTDMSPDNTTHHNAVKNFFKKRLPLYNSSLYLDEELRSPESIDDDSGKHTSPSNSSIKARQLEQLKKEVMQLICDVPEGILCTDLVRLYRDHYNRELNYNRFGYTSIVSLVCCLEEHILITRSEDTGDWLLQDRARASVAPQGFRPRRLRSSYTVLQSSRQLDPDDALPGIDYDPDVFPEDCMHFMESIDSVSLSDFRPGAMVEVMIGEVYSPSHFWFLRVGEEYNFAMEDMMDEMTQYYNGEGRERVLARGAVRVGHYCSTLFEADWHRSLIVKIIDCDTVKVRHVDYGTVDTVPTSALRPLRRAWAALPAQAARARLAAVRPAAGGWRWSRAACSAFLALVSNRRLVANVVARDDRDNIAEMLLIDTSGDDDVCIGSQLIRAGHADARADCSLRTADAYLYPRFEALECGATPNYAEIHAYLRDGIALDYVDEYRAHVPHMPAHAAPSPPPAPPSPAPTPPTPPANPEPPPNSLTPSPTPEMPFKADESVSQPELPTRIPLLLPDRPDPPKSAPVLREAASTPRRSGARRGPLLPTPPSYLSPLAPAYVPGARYASLGAPVPPSPPPPYAAPPCAPGLALSAAECDTYRMLASVNPEAAHWFILGALGHAMSHTQLPRCGRDPPHYTPPHAAAVPNYYPPPSPPMYPPLPVAPAHPPGLPLLPHAHAPAPWFTYPPHVTPTPAPSLYPTPMHPPYPIPPTPMYLPQPIPPTPSSHPTPSTPTPWSNPRSSMPGPPSLPTPLSSSQSTPTSTSLPTSIPSSHRTTVPSSHPTSVPSSHPTSVPSSHPTSVPSSHHTSVSFSHHTSGPSSHSRSMPSSHPTPVHHTNMHPQQLIRPPPGFGY